MREPRKQHGRSADGYTGGRDADVHHHCGGGELTVEMLDLQFNPVTNFYDGPPQMKANNGVLIIDDFGRQRIRLRISLTVGLCLLTEGSSFSYPCRGQKIP